MQLKQLEYLLEISKTKSITKAAENLYITQPALSSSIKALEEELGVSLLIRTPKGTSLTEQGTEMLKGIQQIQDIIHGWEKHFGSQKKPTSQFEIVISSVLKSEVSKIMLDLLDAYPDIQFTVHSITGIYKDLGFIAGEEKKIYLFFCGETVSAKTSAEKYGYKLNRICADDLCVYVNAHHPLAKKNVVKINEIKNMDVFLMGNAEHPSLFWDELYRQNSHVHIIDDRKIVMEYLQRRENCVVIMTRLAGKIVQVNENITVIPIDDADSRYALNLFVPKEYADQPIIQNFQTLIQKQFSR